MGMFLGMLGVLGVPVCGIWLLVCFFRANSKKPPLIGLMACVVLFVAGASLDMPDDNTPPDTSESLLADTDLPEEEEPSEEAGEPEPEPESPSGGALQAGVYELPCGVKLRFYDAVPYDTTGSWRLSKISSELSSLDYAMDYYETMFSSDGEIHAVWNTAQNTTTRITASNGLLFIDTLEYVDIEEQGAKLLFSGEVLDSQILDLETGKPLEEFESTPDVSEPEPEAEAAPAPEPEQEPSSSQPAAPAETPTTDDNTTPEDTDPAAEPSVSTTPPPPTEGNSESSGNGNNFNTYDNEEQQQTEDQWVLNTSTMKIHYPTCREVKKIAPQNYSTSNLDESELIAQGYTTCGVCH